VTQLTSNCGHAVDHLIILVFILSSLVPYF
jgi:hypothetical protein